MGLDKLRLITEAPISEKFCDFVNQDIERRRREPLDRFLNVKLLSDSRVWLDPWSQATVVAWKNRICPAFFLQTGFSAFDRDSPKQIVETNPNKMPKGLADLEAAIRQIFGEIPPDLHFSRIDLNAELKLTIDTFFRSVRVPYKRKSTTFAQSAGEKIRVHGDCGVTGFQLGASPSILRVYDKVEEARSRRFDGSLLPPTLTRFEWELRHRKCPVSSYSQLPSLLEYRPFDKLEFLSTEPGYDFRGSPAEATKRFLFDRLGEEYGAHEARRILTRDRNFTRNYRGIVLDSGELRDQLQLSYAAGIERILNNQQGDPYWIPQYRPLLRWCENTSSRS